MLEESGFRSADLPAPHRFDAWCDRVGRDFVQLDSPRPERYDAEHRQFALGPVTVWPARFDPVVFRRTRRLVRQFDPETYHLSLLLDGQEARVLRNRGVTAYRRFDYHVSDSSQPYDLSTGRVAMVGVDFPKAVLPLPRESAERAVGLPMTWEDGVGALLAQYLVRLTQDTAAYRPADTARLGGVLLDLVASVFANALDARAQLPPETRTRELTLRIRAFIGQNLHDQELTPSSVAAYHHISRGHLHRLFRAEADTVAGYIRRKRLQAAHRDLSDPALAGTPIHAIAERWGFPRAADFTRAFRAVFGVPPREHRHRALLASGGGVGEQAARS